MTMEKIIEKMFEVIAREWNNIFAQIISLASLVISIIAMRRTTAVNKQEKQEPLYKDIKRLLKSREDYRSAEEKVKNGTDCKQHRKVEDGTDCKQHRKVEDGTDCKQYRHVSDDEKDRIIRETSRYFGRKASHMLEEILKLCQRAKEIDADMNNAFEDIKEKYPEDYDKLKSILFLQDGREISDAEEKENEEFLKTISIPYYQEFDELPGKRYNYLELDEKISKIDREVKEKEKALMSVLDRIMRKR